MDQVRKRVPSEVLKRGYSDEELGHIYELARLMLENGDVHKAEGILHGINQIAPDYAAAWLGMTYVHFVNNNTESAVLAARLALKADPSMSQALLALIAGLMSLGDYNSAGTHLGEVGEKIESGVVDDPRVIRFYRAQLARYQSR